MGTLDGQDIKQATLVSATGVEVDIMHYGIVVRDWPSGGTILQRRDHGHFPSVLCDPDRPYTHWCEIEIS